MGMKTVTAASSQAVYITLLALGVVFTATRTVLRWKKVHSIQVEDYLVWLATVFYVCFLSLYIAVFPVFEKIVFASTGVLPPYADIVKDSYYMLACLFASQLLFWSTLWTIKLSLLFWFRRLTKGLPKYTLIWRCIAGFTLLSFVACVATQFTSCRSISAWLTPGACSSARDDQASTISIYFVLAMDLLTDLLIMVIPIKLLWNLRISMGEKISIGIIFSAGTLTMVFAILRVVMYKMPQYPDMTILGLFSAIEAFIAIVVGCLPSFAVFLQTRRLNTSNANKVPSKITVNTRITVASSRIKSKARTESILLDDVAESTRQLDKNKASFDRSSTSLPHSTDRDEYQTRRYGV